LTNAFVREHKKTKVSDDRYVDLLTMRGYMSSWVV